VTLNDLEDLAEIIAKEVVAIISSRASPGRWLTFSEAMKYAKVKSPTTLRKWIDEGFIYAFKRSGVWIVDRESIDDWFTSEKLS
jgi:hypothetical protein